MFDRVRDIFDKLMAGRRRRANLLFFSTLSDEVLRDIGVERIDIEATLSSQPAKGRQPVDRAPQGRCLSSG